MFCVVAPLDHKYVKGEVPPVTLIETAPILLLLQIIFVEVVVALIVAGDKITAEPVLVHPLAPVTVTVYVPAARFEILVVVALLDQR